MPTTLVTGASSGIGLELAKQFSAGGENVVMTARSEDNLLKIANDLEQRYNVSAIIIPSDLSKLEQVDLLYEKMNEPGIQIDTMVNNAGFGALGKFADLSVDRQTDMLMVNVVALTRLTRKLTLYVRPLNTLTRPRARPRLDEATFDDGGEEHDRRSRI